MGFVPKWLKRAKELGVAQKEITFSRIPQKKVCGILEKSPRIFEFARKCFFGFRNLIKLEVAFEFSKKEFIKIHRVDGHAVRSGVIIICIKIGFLVALLHHRGVANPGLLKGHASTTDAPHLETFSKKYGIPQNQANLNYPCQAILKSNPGILPRVFNILRGATTARHKPGPEVALIKGGGNDECI